MFEKEFLLVLWNNLEVKDTQCYTLLDSSGIFGGGIQYLERESAVISAINISLKYSTTDSSLAKWALRMSAFSQNPSSDLLIYIVAQSRIILITLEILYVNSSSHNSDFSLISSSKAIRYWLKIVSGALSVTIVAHLLLL